uniref:Uncharacterized protein n=1 Tax=Ananas comosus var. bracteatus TaxID=296719 RepID=A0A6V7QCM2_ANACO|nr:unnamed protein product [Ananas comosus var. bracteatus]
MVSANDPTSGIRARGHGFDSRMLQMCAGAGGGIVGLNGPASCPVAGGHVARVIKREWKERKKETEEEEEREGRREIESTEYEKSRNGSTSIGWRLGMGREQGVWGQAAGEEGQTAEGRIAGWGRAGETADGKSKGVAKWGWGKGT